MIPIRKLNELTAEERDRLFNRFGEDFSSVMINTVVPIINDVKKRGDAAVIDYTERYDGIRLVSPLASSEEIVEGHQNTDPEIVRAFELAKSNIEEFHSRQKSANLMYTRSDGTTLGRYFHAMGSAAVYVPGGKAAYPSSVLMGVIPARIAGVKNISVITPPDKRGRVPDVIAAVCSLLKVETVIKAGGAQAIAAAGFGTESIPRADIIVGPGNIYVTAAKTYLFSLGVIQIDSMAGPSEVLIISDDKADPSWVACDLLSQAEHEENAAAILVTTSRELAEAVAIEVQKDLDSGSGRHEIKKSAITNNGLILIADNIDQAIAFSNSYAPEHMELLVENPLEYLNNIRNVGSLFLGPYAPVAVGDYFSGTNHILPTGGAARFSSGTSVETFMRRTTFQMLSREALAAARDAVNIMAEVEGFADKHGGSVNARFSDKLPEG